LKKTTDKNPLNAISIVYFLQAPLFTEFLSRTTTIPPVIFRGRALWADSVSPRMNTIASRDQFKPIRIGENLVMNYNLGYYILKDKVIKMFSLLRACFHCCVQMLRHLLTSSNKLLGCLKAAFSQQESFPKR